MRRKLRTIERQQRRSHALPDTVFHAITFWPVVQQRRTEPGGVHVFRAGQHQVEFELVIGSFGHLLTQRATRRQRVKGANLLLKMVCGRIPQQRQCTVLIAWPECRQQGIVLTQPGLLIPGHTVLSAVLQTG
ncbi:hypothetical protein D3C76_1025480 [compost metagenome]